MQGETHNYCKRPRHVLDADSSSDSSIYKSTSKLWESLKKDYSFLINDKILDPDEDVDEFQPQHTQDCISVDRCLVLATELYCWLKRNRKQLSSHKTPRISVYFPSLELYQLQKYENKRRALFSLAATVLPEVTRAESNNHWAQLAAPAKSAVDRSEPVGDHQSTERSMDTSTFTQLAELLRCLSSEWDEAVQQARPTDALEDKDKLFENIRMDLEEINLWLNMLQSSLPSTSSWMTILDRLTEVQKHSVSKYYQTNLKQVENHVRTISSANDLLHRVTAESDSDSQHRMKVHEFTQSISHFEAMCHLTWLQLLEFTTYLEHNILKPRTHTRNLRDSIRNQSRKSKALSKHVAGLLRSESCAVGMGSSRKIRMRFPSCNVVDNPLESYLNATREMKGKGSNIGLLSESKSKMLSPSSQKGALESGFESELSPQPRYYIRKSGDLIDGESGVPMTISADQHHRFRQARTYSTSMTNLVEGSKDSTQRVETISGSVCAAQTDRFEVLVVPEDCSKISTLTSTNATIARDEHAHPRYPLFGSPNPSPTQSSEHSESSTSDPALKELLPVSQQYKGSQACNESLSHTLWRNLSQEQQQRQLQRLRLIRGYTKRIAKRSISRRNCRSTPVLSTLSPLYRIAMRKPLKRIWCADSRGAKPERIPSEGSRICEAQLGTDGRPRTSIDAKLIWPARLIASRVDKTTEADLEDLSTQEVSVATTTPPSGFLDTQKLGHTSTTPAPFVLVRHKSHRAPVMRGRRRRPSHRRSHPFLWHHKPHCTVRDPQWPSTRTCVGRCIPVPPKRAHSVCVPEPCGLDNVSETTKITHSDSSSIDGDANDPKYRLWQTRVKSYLDAAAQADALVRRQYGHLALRQWLSPTGEHKQPGLNSSEDEGSPRGFANRRKLRMSLSAGMDSTRVLDYQEPLLNFWDDYQAPLYSSSSDTDGCEPVSTYAEEFPWDDMAASCLSDVSQEDLFLREIQASKPKSSPYAPFHSVTTTTPADAENNVNLLPTGADSGESPVFRQDTMDLSTSTSVLFNQKSSSLEVSFEVCSQSAATGETLEIPRNQFNETELLCGMRTHPDGGSQHCLNSELTSEAAQDLALSSRKTGPPQTSPCVSVLESHLVTRVPPTNPENFTSSLEPSHPFLNLYMTDSRKCQTLPRASAKRKCRQQLTSDEKLKFADGESRLSATVSLNELHDWSDRGPRLDILRFSQQRLEELQALFSRLMRITPIHIDNTKTDSCAGMTLHHWQNSLSHLIHLAEANLQLLTDNTLGSVVRCGRCSCGNRKSTKADTTDLHSKTLPGQPHKWSNCPELTCLQLQWIRFVYQARYWLLQSYSQDSMKQQLRSLKTRISQLNQTIQHVLAFPNNKTSKPKTFPLFTDQGEPNASLFESEKRSQNQGLKKQIQHCVNKVAVVGEQVQRLREEFERHVIREQKQWQKQQQQQSCDFEFGEPTTTFVALRDDSLVHELDQLSLELSANQQRLSSWLAMQSKLPVENSSDEQDWEYLEYSKDFAQPSSEIPKETVAQIAVPEPVAEDDRDVDTSSTHGVLCPPSATLDNKHHFYVLLIAGGFMALTCFCCYLVTQMIPCEDRPFGWRVSLLVLERLLGLGDDASIGCPLRRERLSSLVDYTPGSLPF